MYNKCVINKQDENGIQITVDVHVDDLQITSESSGLIDQIENHLRTAYGTIKVKKGDVIDYVGWPSILL